MSNAEDAEKYRTLRLLSKLINLILRLSSIINGGPYWMSSIMMDLNYTSVSGNDLAESYRITKHMRWQIIVGTKWHIENHVKLIYNYCQIDDCHKI